MRNLIPTLFIAVFCCTGPTAAGQRLLDAKMHHLRIGGEREWSAFPQQAEATQLVVKFAAKKNISEQTLRLRQQDVKQTWRVSLNGNEVGRLRRDENDMVVYLPIPAKALRAGENTLAVEQIRRKTPDDVRVGEIVLDDRPVKVVLSEATVEIQVVDADTNKPLPSRITVLNKSGALATVGAESNDFMAVRPGIVFTAGGKAKFGLPAGEYVLYAGRGFEWGLDSIRISLKPGDAVRRRLSIRREVPTDGYVSCDTHVHTLTFSGHGDASIQERMVTTAAEGIELPIATDHNVHIDYEQFAKKQGVRKHFTPVIGNEFTTRIGHFNIFPIKPGAAVPDHRPTDWKLLFKNIFGTPEVKVVILNHGRDVHSGYRPFGPKHHNSVTGQNLDGWNLRANAMELINSGATQTDVMRLYRDWFGLLNRGLSITPVGSSDSHDVGRHFVGQGRTYVRCGDDDPDNIDVDRAVDSFVKGRVMVSYGLLSEIKVNGKFGPGQTVPVQGDVDVFVRVLGPGWVTAERVELYANGQKIREAKISQGGKPGVKWKGRWTLRRLRHDMHLVAVARGPGIEGLFWPTAKPYQPTSPEWESYVVGSTGAVWLDVDGDGRRTSAYQYAMRLIASKHKHNQKLPKLLESLAAYDAAVAVQAAGLLQASGMSLLNPVIRAQIKKSAPQTRRGFETFLAAWRESQIARSGTAD